MLTMTIQDVRPRWPQVTWSWAVWSCTQFEDNSASCWSIYLYSCNEFQPFQQRTCSNMKLLQSKSYALIQSPLR